MARYIVLPGRKTFGGNAPGTILELTDAEYSGLDHLLRLVPDEPPSAPAEQAEAGDSGDGKTKTPVRRSKRTQDAE